VNPPGCFGRLMLEPRPQVLPSASKSPQPEKVAQKD
jgi:hypothetical protein